MQIVSPENSHFYTSGRTGGLSKGDVGKEPATQNPGDPIAK